MNTKKFHAQKMFTGSQWLDSQVITVENGIISSIQDAVEPLDSDVQPISGSLVAGYIDIQVNGGGGVLFNNQPELSTLVAMVKAHSQYGTTAMLPTVITDELSVMTQAADAVSQAISSQTPGIIGIHFEGPHLSIKKKGVHPAESIRELSEAEMAIFKRDDLGIKLITIAPENVLPAQIKQLVEANVIVCLGHSFADFDTTNKAIEAGATGFTHLYNAMSGLDSRQPGMLGSALLAKETYSGIILDLLHVHPASAKIACQIKGIDKMILVTDAMALIGSEQTEFELFGETVALNGNQLNIETGQLAGSHLTMEEAVLNAIKYLNLPLEDVLNMASLNPAQFLKQSKIRGQIQVGASADWVVLDSHNCISQTWIAAEQVFPLT
ncbi:N-acetylglucosamine-6-phosphate deacetylase [Catenovulum maritimum]|uniref:N-acetylgalactosamine-6-phosphate deacetylase n=1 Tax=Catenovulum maritimum TaxID=1513271 RepID=A0A0J8GSQ7_9ALTE|nr:N-acetylglucosamine-6-phosphate deacetylase [Catenovulum maritimum]KMT65825.1 N-acetylglucosamine 6-phosphate deacetylase [Catenovulum maritimum]